MPRGAPKRVASRLPPDGAAALEAAWEDARATAKTRGADQALSVVFILDASGRVTMDVHPGSVDVPRRFCWRSAVDGGPVEDEPNM